MLRNLLVAFISVVFIFGIGILSFAQTHSGHGESTEGVAGQVTSKKAVNVGNKVCPVSGEKIDDKMKVTYEYEGKIYNFCCPMCVDEFKKDPQKYIQKVEENLQADSEAKTHQDSDIEKVNAYQESGVESKEQSKHEGQGMEMKQESGTSHQGTHQGHHH